MEYRHVKLADAASILELMHQCYAQTPYLSLEPDEFQATLMDEEVYLIKNFLTNAHNKLIVVEHQGRIIAQASLHRNSTARKSSHYAVLGIIVDQEFKNQGIGSNLMKHILHEGFHLLNYEFITLSVCAKNDVAIHLYQTFGFECYGCLKNGFKYKDGSYDDNLLMVLRKEDYIGTKR